MYLLAHVLLCVVVVYGKITQIPLPSDIRYCFENSETDVTSVGEVIFTRCVHRVLWKRQSTPEAAPLGDDAVRWISGLVDMNHLNDLGAESNGNTPIGKSRHKRQSLPRRQPRVRKEYRQLSEIERRLFHRALNMLKADTTVAPNKYDALGRLHYQSVGRAHFGPSFLPWHRLFLVVMENALREKIPSVTIPYWDTTLDDELLDPRSSILWTPDFLGSANGFVVDGPFANWDTPTGQLVRQFGMGGTMLNWTYIHNAFRQNHLENITSPYALPDNNLEEHHNQVHLWVGGQMTPPALAAFDPVFYLVHSYVDLLWEIFRGLQRRRGIDPTTDYPLNETEIPRGQRYNDSSGFGILLNRHGLSNVFTDNIYKYDRPPSCTRDNPVCGSRHLRCDVTGPQPKCVTASIFDIRPLFTRGGLPMAGGSGIRELRSTGSKRARATEQFTAAVNHLSDVKCQANNINEKYVNTFDLNGVVDKQLWAYIPVNVIYKNKPSSQNTSIPVYDTCLKPNNTNLPRRIFIETNGLNYNGMFKEISHFRDIKGTDNTLSYVAVRKPTAEQASQVIISAYDACGRICQPYCLDRTGRRSSKCAGAVKISKQVPLMYGNDVTSVINNIWQEDRYGLPKLAEYEIFVSFVCDTNLSHWPWSSIRSK